MLKLVDDIAALKPSLFIGVPRVFDRIYSRIMGQVCVRACVRAGGGTCAQPHALPRWEGVLVGDFALVRVWYLCAARPMRDPSVSCAAVRCCALLQMLHTHARAHVRAL